MCKIDKKGIVSMNDLTKSIKNVKIIKQIIQGGLYWIKFSVFTYMFAFGIKF